MRPARPPLGRLAASGLLATAALAAPAAAAESPALGYARQPPEKIVTAEACAECHVSAAAVWRETAHARGFKTLHRNPDAEAIAERMGFRLLKRDSLCLSCHYTAKVEGDELRAVSGVSCESCHGAGRDWINVHNNYGPGHDRATESAEHRERRIADSRAAGMRRPSDLYDVAASCFGCHTVPNEELVNVGGHTTGSIRFELVARAQGEIRHNFLQSFLTGDGTVNRERTPAERRALYVVGRAADLEYSLRAAAEATGPGVYAGATGRRVRQAAIELRKIGDLTALPEVDQMVAAVREVQVVPGNRGSLLAAADRVGAAARRFVDRHRGPEGARALAALDPLVRGDPLPERLAGGGPAPPTGAPATGSGTGAGTASAAAAGGAAAVTDPGTPVVGEFKTRIRPRPEHGVLGPVACSGCHRPANDWYAGDAHSRSAQPFFDRSRKRVEIALLYGVRPADMVKGNQVCMNCHGTVISGNEPYEVYDGVGCESCHGPAGDYIERHKEGDKALGERRPGYVAALGLGMVELRDLGRRAGTCSGCHYVTDRRLLSAGHPSGEGFDYVAGMAKVRHWEPADADAALRSAFASALAAHGPVPSVPRGELPRTVDLAAAAAEAPAGNDTTATGGGWNVPRPSTLAGGGAGPAGPPAPVATGPIALPPFSRIEESATIEETLLAIQRRLEQIYRALAPP